MMGDFNCPDIQWSTLSSTSPLSSALCDFVFAHNVYQAVEFPTHTMGNVLDLVLTNSADLLTNVTVSSEVPSDHFCIKLDVNLPSRKLTPSSSSSFYDYSKADLEGLCDFLLDWDFHDCSHLMLKMCGYSSNLLLKWEFLSLCLLFLAIVGIHLSLNGSIPISGMISIVCAPYVEKWHLTLPHTLWID